MDREVIIKYCLRFETDLKNLYRLYTDLGTLISDEHQAIGRSDFDSLDIELEKKETLGKKIVLCSEKLLKLSREVVAAARTCDLEDVSVGGLTDLFVLLKRLSPKQESDLGSKVLNHLMEKIDHELMVFFKVFKEVKPRVEQNRYIVGKLLQRHRENLRIWQETMSDAEGTYNQGGETSFRNQCSVIQVKA